MRRDDDFYLGHMLDTALAAIRLVRNVGRKDFEDNETLRIALTHLVQVIGEAARLVSDGFKEEHAEIPWKAIVGMRHKIVHDYFSVDEDVVWETVTKELQPLVKRLQEIVS